MEPTETAIPIGLFVLTVINSSRARVHKSAQEITACDLPLNLIITM